MGYYFDFNKVDTLTADWMEIAPHPQLQISDEVRMSAVCPVGVKGEVVKVMNYYQEEDAAVWI